MNTKIKVEEITVETLLKEALNIPNGWHEEVWVEDGFVVFSAPMTQNSWSTKGVMNGTEPNYIGDLDSTSIGDFEGFYQREDGKIEINDPDGESENPQVGEYYEKAEIVEFEEGIERILDSAVDPDETEWAQIIRQIQEV